MPIFHLKKKEYNSVINQSFTPKFEETNSIKIR